jgi:hypothetical protein
MFLLYCQLIRSSKKPFIALAWAFTAFFSFFLTAFRVARNLILSGLCCTTFVEREKEKERERQREREGFADAAAGVSTQCRTPTQKEESWHNR